MSAALLAALLAAAPARAARILPAVSVRLEAALSKSALARRLLVADADVPRVEAHASGLPLAADVRGGSRPEIVLDLERLRTTPEPEALAEYADALARAAIASPIRLVEADQASRQWTVEILVELASSDRALTETLDRGRPRSAKREPVLARAAEDLAAFERSPDALYWRVESSDRRAERLTDVEDLYALHGPALRALKGPPRGPYGALDGRRYPARLVRAAFALRALGERQRLREALGSYDAIGVDSLKDAIERWRRGEPARTP